MLHVHRADRADGLAAVLADLLAEPLDDPFEPEVVCVPTRGVERWLAQRLSHRLGTTEGRADGICANVLFPSPRRLVGDAIAAATGIAPEDDPWQPERLAWPLLDLIDRHIDDEWLRLLAAHISASSDTQRSRRMLAASHLAQLYERYAFARPSMLRDWATGNHVNDRGHELPPAYAWQARLYRAAIEHISGSDLAERILVANARLREEDIALDLPRRVAAFNLTRLSAGELDVLEAIGRRRDVHLLVLHPSRELWSRVAESPIVRGAGRAEARQAGVRPRNRLLASWGWDAHELQISLLPRQPEDHALPAADRPHSLLGRLQRAVSDDAVPLHPFPLLEPNDRSIQVHACHGRARQVEVVRDAILHLLADNTELEPRDVIVMCPDIETYAPLIQATFGAAVSADDEDADLAPAPELQPPHLRVRLADRSLRQTNPMLAVMSALLELADQRLTASQVLDFADREPVRHRFALDDEDLARLRRWTANSEVRWGLDAQHRAAWRLGDLRTGTWESGLDRLLLGVALPAEQPVLYGGVLPVDDVESGSIELAGRLAELVDRLAAAVRATANPMPVADWVEMLREAADSLAATSPRNAWQRAELERVLERLGDEAGTTPAPLCLAEVRALLADRLRGRPTRANFRTGHLTICTLHPMRSVPHRVVCLLGLDDGAFPRKAPRDGDDLLLVDPLVGEHDPRSEDRQMLLDALMAAEDYLVMTYAGRDERTNAPRPPAVPVGELLDAIDETVQTEDGTRARDHVLTHHPLQPFDPRNFQAATLLPSQTWSFERVMLAGAQRLLAGQDRRPPFMEAPLDAIEPRVLALDDLAAFVRHPVAAFLRQRLGISLSNYSDEVDDALPLDLDGLQRWAVGERLLKAILRGTDGRLAVKAEIARGSLPPDLLGKPILEDQWPIVDALVQVAEQAVPAGAAADSVGIEVTLPQGVRLTGTVAGIHGEVLRTVSFSRMKPKTRLEAWVRWLALTAAEPERDWTSFAIGRAPNNGANACAFVLDPADVDPATRRALALERLALLADMHRSGMREPLPIYSETSAAYARAVLNGDDPWRPASKAWRTEWRAVVPGEDRDAAHLYVLGPEVAYRDLLSEPPRPDEAGPGWDEGETSRFGRLAMRLWTDILSTERRAV